MVPSFFALLPALPRNASGKLDRRALAIPQLEATSAGGYEAPATPAEEAVAYVWRDVLGVPRVGRKDDFFALGGRSRASSSGRPPRRSPWPPRSSSWTSSSAS